MPVQLGLLISLLVLKLEKGCKNCSWKLLDWFMKAKKNRGLNRSINRRNVQLLELELLLCRNRNLEPRLIREEIVDAN